MKIKYMSDIKTKIYTHADGQETHCKSQFFQDESRAIFFMETELGTLEIDVDVEIEEYDGQLSISKWYSVNSACLLSDWACDPIEINSNLDYLPVNIDAKNSLHDRFLAELTSYVNAEIKYNSIMSYRI